MSSHPGSNRYTERLKKFGEKLDEISPHFCAAKWLQVTLHLQIGHNHSCHHVRTHPIPKECVDNPSLLHNTPYKKDIWKKIMNGEIISECDYCNNAEKNSTMPSDRVLKSNEIWAKPNIMDIIKNPYKDIVPTYIEVNFSHICNCQCSYCSPWISSRWETDVIKNGPYPTSSQFGELRNDKLPIVKDNIYVEAFWKWWPTIIKKVCHFRITGGEPLLHKDTFKVIDYLLENPSPDLEFSINTNLCVPEKIFIEFLNKVKKLVENNCVKKLTIFSSCEGYKEASEYSRYGLDYDYWWKCVDNILKIDRIEFIIMATYNIFSVTSFLDFLKDIYRRKEDYKERFFIDIPILRNPSFLCANILTRDYLIYLEECLSYIYERLDEKQDGWKDKRYFINREYNGLSRLYNVLEKEMDNAHDLKRNRSDFFKFVNEWDKRKELTFLKTFPEMKNFYDLCGDIR